MRIAIIGAGYVGLVNAACLAARDETVFVLERDPERVALVKSGRAPFFEPGLDSLLDKEAALPGGRLVIGTDPAAMLDSADAVLICVGTPPGPDGPDVSQVLAAAEAIRQYAPPSAVVVIRSTCPPGTNARVRALLPGHAVLTVPEFLAEGTAIADFNNAARKGVVGASVEDLRSWEAGKIAALLTNERFILVSPESAEMIKLGTNGMLAARVSYVNALAELCETIPGADIRDVACGIGLDPRIGPRYLQAGPGYGGSCLPKDLLALERAQDTGRQCEPFWATRKINEWQVRRWTRQIRKATPDGGRICVLGASFKGNTSDQRESPAIALFQALRAEPCGFEVVIADPSLPGGFSPREITGCATLVVATDWPEFRELDLIALAQANPNAHLFDLRNLFDAQTAIEAGFAAYYPVGASPSFRPARPTP